MLDLIRLGPRDLFPPGGRELYHQIAVLTEMAPEDEVLVAACGNGVTLEYFVEEHDVHGSGVDEAEHLVQAAEERAREKGISSAMQFQHGPLETLPYRDGIFDVTVGELGLTTSADPDRALQELVRVTRPGGAVVLIQLVWTAQVDEERRQVLARHLGTRPLMLVEWKRILREAGVEQIHTEDWSDERTAFRAGSVKPFPDFAELFSLPEKLRILRRAWGRWGWTGVRTVLAREREVHRLLTQERILALDLVKGVRQAAPPDPASEAGDAAEEAADGSGAAPATTGSDAAAEAAGGPGPAPDAEEPPPAPDDLPGADDEDAEVEGLPLFTPKDDTP